MSPGLRLILVCIWAQGFTSASVWEGAVAIIIMMVAVTLLDLAWERDR